MNYSQIAAAILAACIAQDPYAARPSAETAKAWGRQFEKYQLSIDDLLAAVDVVYEQHGTDINGERYRPLPKDITDAARAIRRERAERETDAERQAREDHRDAQLDRRRLTEITSQVGVTVGKAVDDA